ncbi:tetratricopeptide repeat-containing protein [Paraburkholderia sp. J7]|uniref:tetratricopeptide repeat-containing protein n=1 Tax=Paraburkholderia sp. J7 TaxID=2805438 RepID=UPI002AB6255E|nr:tetratricopeptide repeat-containing protein [Paraburkholderia sp. J7]
METSLSDAESAAREIIGGKDAKLTEVLALEEVLRRGRKFGTARKILERCADHRDLVGNAALRLKVGQKRALCTYKDPDLANDKKLDDAFRILQSVADLETTDDQETLGLAGAIFKRKWELTAQVRYLESSFAFYYRGYRQGVETDFGYTAINAAFVLECLADIVSVPDQPANIDVSLSPQRREAMAIRREIVDKLPSLPEQPGKEWLRKRWWFLVTLGEAYFGLEACEPAREWLMKAAALPDVPDWEQESTARQIGALLVMKRDLARQREQQVDPRLEEVLREFLGAGSPALESALRGKVGLALSGGGFRASFYHIGVLAKLAELDLLRHVECLSCVSGGSIIGAHYYLEARKLLQEKPDQEIGREDYIRIVQRIEADFFEGVKSNVRTRIAAEWLTNMKLIFFPGYSRTMRAGELYESEIFSRVDDGEGNKDRWLNDIKICPKGAQPDFSPKDHNWRRAAKAPVLVLNATTLNTGHNWNFTASWMGEPPAGIDSEVDANYRLRRMYYSDAPSPHERVRLGYAVAASACVPGIFEPLTLANIYERKPATEDRMVRPLVRLVDGGVYDNQGVAALLEHDCSVLIVSDASGQMQDLDFPSNGLLGVPLRANSILQARVRVAQFEQLSGRLRGGLLKGLLFVHLKKDLETTPVDWIDTQEPSPPPTPDPLTKYGIQRHIQRLLAGIRTDLDSFSETEAYGLMASGYLMTEHYLDNTALGFPVPPQTRQGWTFLEIERFLKDRRRDAPLVTQLKVANTLFFKVWLLMRQLQIIAGVFAIFALTLLAYSAYVNWNQSIFTLSVKQVASAVGFAALSLLGLGMFGKFWNYRKTATEILIGVGMATFGFALARLHLHLFDKLFLWQGTMRRLKGHEPTSTVAPAQPARP